MKFKFAFSVIMLAALALVAIGWAVPEHTPGSFAHFIPVLFGSTGATLAMAALFIPVDAPERSGVCTAHPVAAATLIVPGVLVALDANGNAVQADDVAGLTVLGRSEAEADNSSGLAGDARTLVKRGVFRYNNSVANALALADVGRLAFVQSPDTVAKATTHSIGAGIVVEVDSNGVWIDTRSIPRPSTVALSSTNGTAAAASANLAALAAETEKIGDDVRALHAALVAANLISA